MVQQLSVKLYEQMAQQQGGEPHAHGDADGAGAARDNVVDADYTVVDENKK
ncbi:Chaperone protein DnaK [compost metagenome]